MRDKKFFPSQTWLLLFVIGVLFVLATFFVEKDSITPKKSLQGEKDKQTFKVVKVIDGDTIKLSDGRSLRYIGIDTAEHPNSKSKSECFSRESFEENKELVEGKTIIMEKDVSETDLFARLLRYVYIDDVFINDYLVRQGFAYASSYPPDVKYQEQFRNAEREARENNRGLWGSC